jgi:hypothetical protein
MEINELTYEEKFKLLKKLLKDVKPVFEITGTALDSGKYCEFSLDEINLTERESSGSTSLIAKVFQTDSCFIKYE